MDSSIHPQLFDPCLFLDGEAEGVEDLLPVGEFASAAEVFSYYVEGRRDPGSGPTATMLYSEARRFASFAASSASTGASSYPAPTGLSSVLEGVIREIVRQELRDMHLGEALGISKTDRSSWMTPPAAARELGISEKSVRQMIRLGAVRPRLRNIDPTPKQPKYLVNVAEVGATMSRISTKDAAAPEGVSEQATRIRSRASRR